MADASTSSSSAAASPAPVSPSTPPVAGLSVVLVEKHDLAFGTSRWSSKLVHGGLRYLATGNVGIARRSAVERGILMTRNAPHLVHAMPQLVPLLPSMGRDAAGAGAGRIRSPATGCACWPEPSRRRCRGRAGSACEQAVAMAPTVRRDGLDGALPGLRRPADRRRPACGRRGPHRRAARRPHPDPGLAPRRPPAARCELTDELTGESLEMSARAGDQRDRGVGRRCRPVDQACGPAAAPTWCSTPPHSAIRLRR